MRKRSQIRGAFFQITRACLLAGCLNARADQSPHVGYVYPAGGQVGTTYQVTIGGQRIEAVEDVFFSGTGVRAEVMDHELLPTQQEAMELRNRRRDLNQQTNKTTVVSNELAVIDRKLNQLERKRISPAIGETVPLRVTIAASTIPGDYELRVRTRWGLSNPCIFQVGRLSEFRKPEVGGGEFRPERKLDGAPAAATPLQPPIPVTQPVVVNGWIPPGGVDRFRFPARAGQQLVLVTSARALQPYLADAVPGWIQAVVSLSDARGRALAYDDHYRFRPDPVLCVNIHEDGEYTMEVRDALYRGREDFVYRIAIGELPFVTGVYPLGCRTGTPVRVTLSGWNLVERQLDFPGSLVAGVQALVTQHAVQSANPMPFSVDTLPECTAACVDETLAHAQHVAMPVIINGCIREPGAVHVFSFEGHAGDSVVAETVARRLESPLDSVLRLFDGSGRLLALNDDHEDKRMGLMTHHADSYIRALLPSNGTYHVQLWDAQGKGGNDYAYRLYLHAPQPDFALRVVPSSLSARSGGSVPLTVYALRQDGFDGDIALSLQDAPAGFKLNSARVLTNQDQIKITLSVPTIHTDEPVRLHLLGQARIKGQEVAHPAVPADDLTQAFAYHHLVPAQELDVVVSGRAREVTKVLSATPVKIHAGGTTRVQVQVPIGPRMKKLICELSDPPEGISLQADPEARPETELVFVADPDKVSPGQKGNLIVNLYGVRESSNERATSSERLRRIPLGSLPAIPFEVI